MWKVCCFSCEKSSKWKKVLIHETGTISKSAGMFFKTTPILSSTISQVESNGYSLKFFHCISISWYFLTKQKSHHGCRDLIGSKSCCLSPFVSIFCWFEWTFVRLSQQTVIVQLWNGLVVKALDSQSRGSLLTKLFILPRPIK